MTGKKLIQIMLVHQAGRILYLRYQNGTYFADFPKYGKIDRALYPKHGDELVMTLEKVKA